MTEIQMNALSTQIWKDMGTISESEQLMKRLAKFLSKLVKEKEHQAQMTKEEFYKKLEKAEQEIAEGKGIKMRSDETLDDLLNRML